MAWLFSCNLNVVCCERRALSQKPCISPLQPAVASGATVATPSRYLPINKRITVIWQHQTRAVSHAAPGVFPIMALGLTAYRGDGARDTVENTPMIICARACGGPDGARHAPNDLPRRLSRL